MRWLFRATGAPRALPPEFKRTLTSRFQLEEDVLARALYVEKCEKARGRVIKIFDPWLLNGDVKRFDDLADHTTAVLFEGRFNKDGTLYLADRRPPKTVTRRSLMGTPSQKPGQASF